MSVSEPPPFVSMGKAFFGNISNDNSNHTSPSSQIVKSKIMVVAVAVLFAAVVFIICLHVYAKWFWRHQGVLGVARSGSWRRRRASRRSIGPLATHHNPQQHPLFPLHSVGLEKTVVESLPTFVYKKAGFVPDAPYTSSLPQQQQQLECAVCLEEFAENDTGRTLPKCAHNFHVECIDMWLHSHSTCPLCRASARPDGPAPTDKQTPELAPRGAGAVNEADLENAGAMPRSHRDQERQHRSSITEDLDFRLSASSLTRASTAHEEESAAAGPPAPTTDPSVATAGRGMQQEGEVNQHRPPSRPAKALRNVPSNVLFWSIGMDSSSVQETVSQQLGVAANASGRSSSATTGVQAPFQIVIDIPRGGSSAPEPSSSPFSSSTPKSPMGRFSSLRRLLSRGRTVAAAAAAASSSSSSSPSVSFSFPTDLERAPAPSPTAHS